MGILRLRISSTIRYTSIHSVVKPVIRKAAMASPNALLPQGSAMAKSGNNNAADNKESLRMWCKIVYRLVSCYNTILYEFFAAHLPALPFLSFAEKKETKKAADFKNCLKVGCYLDYTSSRLYCRAKNIYCIMLLKNKSDC